MRDNDNDPPFSVVEAIVKITPTKPQALPAPKTATSSVRPEVEIKNVITSSPSSQEITTVTPNRRVTIGTDFETHVPVTVGDNEREGGFYILGQPRTGKSTLLVSMALADIKNGHGLLFVDPHTDAISDLLARIPEQRLKDVIFLDPTDKTRSFGLNLLHCTDPADPMAIEDTWGRIRDVFVKLWEQETRQLGFWVDKILRNSVYLLVETGPYTMVEVPLLLEEDTTLRNHLLEKVVAKPANLTTDVRGAIGTMVLSELLYAAQERAKLPKEERSYFGVYCDEFQEFTTPDFAKLFTQAGKFGVMPVVAHQTREQFKSRDDPNRGATAASPGKSFFRLSPYDSNEMPLVFTKEPPTEIEYEQQLVISDEPVRDLLTGRHKPEIQEFVDKYLRHLKWRREDTREEIEGERLLRLSDLDEAALFGVDERVAYLYRYSEGQAGALEKRGGALTRAQARIQNIMALHESYNRLRLTFRGLNVFFVDVMEGKKKPGEEPFSDFLISIIGSYARLGPAQEEVLALYVKLSYGDKNKSRVIPFGFAQKHGIFEAATRQALEQAETKRKEEEDRRYTAYISRWENDTEYREWLRRLRAEELWPRLRNIDLRFGKFFDVQSDLLKPYLPICAFASVAKALAPFLTARFGGVWKEAYRTWSKGFPKVMERIDYLRNEEDRPDKVCFSVAFLDSFRAFFEKYEEGAVVALALINMVAFPERWVWELSGETGDASYYPGYNALYLPIIENRKPLEILLCLEQLSVILSECKFQTECAKFYRRSNGKNPYERRQTEFDIHGKSINTDVDNLVAFAGHAGQLAELIEERETLKEVKKVIGFDVWRKYLNVEKHRWWDKCNELVKVYLMARACDTVRFGQAVADVTFPPSDIVGATAKEVAEFTASLVGMVREKEKYREWHRNVPQVVVPEYLEPRVLSAGEIDSVREKCVKELQQADENTRRAVATIDEFAAFCILLAKPENHMRIKGQYVERERRARAEIDMVNEAARLLSSVDDYMAYVRLEKKEGERGAWIGKVQMDKLGGVAADALARARSAVEENTREYLRRREEIRWEIGKRQQKWRKDAMQKPPKAESEEEKKRDEPPLRRLDLEPEEPMPPRSVSEPLKEVEEDKRRQEKEAGGERAARVREDSLPPQAATQPVESSHAPEGFLHSDDALREALGEGVNLPDSLKAIMPIVLWGRVSGSAYGYPGSKTHLTEAEFVRIYSDQYLRLKANGRSEQEIIKQLTEIIGGDMYLSEDGSALGVTYEDEPQREAAVLTTRFYPRGGSEEIRK